MQQRVALPHKQINAELLNVTLKAPLWWWITVGVLGVFVLAALASVAVLVNKGLGVTGLNRPVMWGLFIVLSLIHI